MWNIRSMESRPAPTKVGKWARCALHLAVEQNGDRRESSVCHQIQELLRNGGDIEAVDVFGKTPLLRAAEVGNAVAVTELIQNGASLLARTVEGWTALHLAAGNGHVVVVSQLLDAGCSPFTQDSAGENPMHWAARWGQLSVVEFLMGTSVAPLLLASDNDGRTPVHAAAEYGREEVFEALLRHGAPAHTADRHGWTPLDLAHSFTRKAAALQTAAHPSGQACVASPRGQPAKDGRTCRGQENAISALMSGKSPHHISHMTASSIAHNQHLAAGLASNVWRQY